MKIIVVTGQTATGKTAYALNKAEKENGEVVNFDSRQIYKKLDIITGKDIPKNSVFHTHLQQDPFSIGFYQPKTRTDLFRSVLIWLYDIVLPDEYFSSYNYVQCAIPIIKDILKRGKTPILVGGTYFYLYHLLYGLDTQRVPEDKNLRDSLNQKKVPELQKILTGLDAGTLSGMNSSDRLNPRRLIRKIEILNYQKTYNLPLSALSDFKRNKAPRLSSIFNMNIRLNCIGLRFRNKNNLKTIIKKRVEKRLRQGAVAEVKNLLAQGYSKTDPGLQTIGYRQILAHLEGKLTLRQAQEDWINKEIQYANRQLTFMKKDPLISWIDVD